MSVVRFRSQLNPKPENDSIEWDCVNAKFPISEVGVSPVDAFSLLMTKIIMQIWVLYFLLLSFRSAAATAHFGFNQCFVSTHPRTLSTFSLKEGAVNENEPAANRTQTTHHEENHHNLHPALHQVKHRAQEKATIGIAQHVTENLVSKSPILKKSPQWWMRGTEQIMAILERSKLPEHGGKRLLERSGDRLAERGAEKVAERGAERLIKRGIETSAERGTERIVERGVERMTERGAERIAERGVERVLEGNAERIAERGIERILEGNAERIIERGAFRKGTQWFATNKVERIAESGTKRLVERNGERLAEHVLERSGERGLGRLERRFVERLLPKFGRSLSLALPALGALFGWYLFQQDVKRMSQEQKRRTKALFGVAALTDFMDIVLHVWIVYALWAHLSHSSMIVAEKMSMACAIGSTVSAVLGEIVCSLPHNHTIDSQSAVA